MKFKKIITLSIIALSFSSNLYPTLIQTKVSADQVSEIKSDNNNLNFSEDELNIITNNGQYDYDQSMSETALALEKYFTYNQYGEVIVNATPEQLISDLGITEQQANDILSISELGVRNYNSRGFVGVYVNLGPKVRSMNGWAAGAFAGGYVGWYAKQLAALGPVGAGAAALITTATAATVKWAVENGVRVIPIGTHIPEFSSSYNVYVP